MAKRQSNKPPKNFKDFTGLRIGRLTVVSLHPERGPNWSCRWICKCDCGNTAILRTSSLTYAATQSCGCLQREWARDAHTTHGLHGTKEYDAWRAAKDRCFRKKCKGYPDYGGRGITMCDDWRHDFAVFFRDMGPCPDGLTLERRDVNGNYTPDNCYWATMTAQARNKRTSHSITHEGKTMSVIEWSQVSGISYWTLLRRHKAGQPLFVPVHTGVHYE